ncbi:MAG TPA: PilZ domain-containing protein [Candidatus Dormibacteraeota bacterium]|nr:PilZ domain-containing protein [Candidatus Dormibacteraeota bacterium]
MGNLGERRLTAGARFPDRRAAPRFAFDARMEIIDPVEQQQVTGRVTVLSQKGCFGRTDAPLAHRRVVQVEIRKDESVFESWAWATPSDPDAEPGVVLVFMNTSPEQAKLLASWLVGLVTP